MRSYIGVRVTHNGWENEYLYLDTKQGRRDLKADQRDLKAKKQPSRWMLQESIGLARR